MRSLTPSQLRDARAANCQIKAFGLELLIADNASFNRLWPVRIAMRTWRPRFHSSNIVTDIGCINRGSTGDLPKLARQTGIVRKSPEMPKNASSHFPAFVVLEDP